MVAIQTLWAGPWMTQVAGWSALESATGLFAINLSMLTSFWLWGWITPGLARRGIHVDRLISRGFPLSLLVLAVLVYAGPAAAGGAAALLAAFACAAPLSRWRSRQLGWPSRPIWRAAPCRPTTW